MEYMVGIRVEEYNCLAKQFGFNSYFGIAEIQSENILKVFPNPAGRVYLLCEKPEVQNANIEMYNLLGQQVPVSFTIHKNEIVFHHLL